MFLVLILLAIAGAFGAWLKWRSTSKVVYQGPATLLDVRASRTRGYTYAYFSIPRGRQVRIGFSLVRRQDNMYARMHRDVQIVERKRLFQAARIESVDWGDGRIENIEEFAASEGLYIGMSYLVGAMVLGVFGSDFGLGSFGYYLCALSLVMCGLCLNLFRIKDTSLPITAMVLVPMLKRRSPMLWLAVATLLTIATVLIFSQPGFLMLIPGLNCALELGAVCALICNRAFGPVTEEVPRVRTPPHL